MVVSNKINDIITLPALKLPTAKLKCSTGALHAKWMEISSFKHMGIKIFADDHCAMVLQCRYRNIFDIFLGNFFLLFELL